MTGECCCSVQSVCWPICSAATEFYQQQLSAEQRHLSTHFHATNSALENRFWAVRIFFFLNSAFLLWVVWMNKHYLELKSKTRMKWTPDFLVKHLLTCGDVGFQEEQEFQTFDRLYLWCVSAGKPRGVCVCGRVCVVDLSLHRTVIMSCYCTSSTCRSVSGKTSHPNDLCNTCF